MIKSGDSKEIRLKEFSYALERRACGRKVGLCNA